MLALQHQSNTNPIATNFLDAAAAFERLLHAAEGRNQQLEERLRIENRVVLELRHLQDRHQAETRAWLRAIRRNHRRCNHATTGRCIKAALAALESGDSTLLCLY